MRYNAYRVESTNDGVNITSVYTLPLTVDTGVGTEVRCPIQVGNGRVTVKVWVPSRPVPCPTLMDRIRDAWMVFTGRADVLIWPGQE